MGELDGGRSASFIPFMLPHYWGRGGTARLFIQFLTNLVADMAQGLNQLALVAGVNFAAQVADIDINDI